MTSVFVCRDGHTLTRRYVGDGFEWVDEAGNVFIAASSDGWPIHAGGPEGGQRIGGRVEVRPSDRGGRMTYRVQLIWNREFNFVTYGQHFSDLGEAIEYSEALKDMGDGACVKETRVVDQDGKVVYAYGKPVAQ